MPTRISADVGDHLLFITVIPIDCEITNFSLHLFVCFFEITIINSWHIPNKLLLENLLASTLRSFSAYYAVREQREKHLCNQTSHYGKYGMHTRQKRTPQLSYSAVVLYIGIMKVWGFWPEIITPKPT